ncbi:lysophospholipid acyltransferase family protein [Secundilactobacillus folii]|uniref:1-acyl-sn-glycerol-3-phosphate acyltransferase n=1 Tax=Secundilactobacillus folii TaxID=2678357 RepID=A0A7X3C292_9LACO|nr:lysophospholipid acyltransferase family protein [Secundilactobacillus folii]MTV82590.1 1-acyl-sn-glycerol-3-phosphate acyltransferase [Secundilactobacillus folii]
MSNDTSQVVENIISAVHAEDFHRKVEINDPNLSVGEEGQLLNWFLSHRNTISQRSRTFLARLLMRAITNYENRSTSVIGIENIQNLGSAIITSNHFSPTENTAIRFSMQKLGYPKMAVLSQVANYKMSGVLGFLMRNADTIPVSTNLHYLGRVLPNLIGETLSKNTPILIYPEQEMWWHYRKPRPFMPGAYHYAAKFNVPIISCFTEMQLLDQAPVQGVTPMKYVVHILRPIYPDPQLNEHENSEMMLKQDQAQKKAAYELAYHEPLTYQFEPADIIGWNYGKTTLASDLP